MRRNIHRCKLSGRQTEGAQGVADGVQSMRRNATKYWTLGRKEEKGREEAARCPQQRVVGKRKKGRTVQGQGRTDLCLLGFFWRRRKEILRDGSLWGGGAGAAALLNHEANQSDNGGNCARLCMSHSRGSPLWRSSNGCHTIPTPGHAAEKSKREESNRVEGIVSGL
jgi:hypothetical protein